MQPPPRKVKPTANVKNVHHEQLTKIQQKHHHDVDLLEDVRNFAKQRSQIEKDYAQALMKLANSYLSKKDFYMLPDLPSQDGREHKTATSVWRTVLEVTERIARTRLQAAETYMQHVSEPIKVLKAQKQQNAKKILEQFATIQKEVDQTVREMTKNQKAYNEEEKLAHDARKKADDADDKLKRRSTGLFSSLASLQKNSAKFNTRKDACEEKSTVSRNEYLLSMAACNAHLMRFYQKDMPELMQSLDGEMFERLQQSLTELSKTELECCGITQECFSKALCDSCLISRGYNLQCFLTQYPAFTELMQYQFEPCENDAIHKVSNDVKGDNTLDQEAKKWASKVAKETKAIAEYGKLLKSLLTDGDKKDTTNGSSPDSEAKDSKEKPVDPEVKMEECRENIRKAQTAKLKAEARLEILKDAGVDTEEWLNKANMDTLSPTDLDDEVSRTSDQVSMRTSSSGGASHSEDTSYHNGPTASPPYYNEEDYDMNDETFDRSTSSGGTNQAPTGARRFPCKGIALYDFAATSQDEMTMAVNEEVTIVGIGDGEGWVKARSAIGHEGYIPENYISYLDDQPSYTPTAEPDWGNSAQAGSGTGQASGATQSQSGYGTDRTSYCSQQSQQSSVFSDSGEQGPLSPPPPGVQTEAASSYSSTDYEIQSTMEPQDLSLEASIYAKALYDYDGNTDEELSFQEGQVIKVTNREPHGVDDGWWSGELGGKKGVFPSMVVMELTVEELANDALSPVRPGPPAFAPPSVSAGAPGGPPVPPVASPPPPVTVTLPTPPRDDNAGTLIDLDLIGGANATNEKADATDGTVVEPPGGNALDDLLMEQGDGSAVLNPVAATAGNNDTSLVDTTDAAPGSPMPDRNKTSSPADPDGAGEPTPATAAEVAEKSGEATPVAEEPPSAPQNTDESAA